MPTEMRQLYKEEAELLTGLARGREIENVVSAAVASGWVEEMPDGGMRSLRFIRMTPLRMSFGREALEGRYMDSDGVSVSLTLNLDSEGYLLELDIFKADSTPLRRYPSPEEILITT